MAITLYMLQYADTGWYKIGSTDNLDRRLGELATVAHLRSERRVPARPIHVVATRNGSWREVYRLERGIITTLNAARGARKGDPRRREHFSTVPPELVEWFSAGGAIAPAEAESFPFADLLLAALRANRRPVRGYELLWLERVRRGGVPGSLDTALGRKMRACA